MLIQALDGPSAPPSPVPAAEGVDASTPPQTQPAVAAAAVAAPAQPSPPPALKDIERAVSQVNEAVQKVATNLEFAVDKDTDTVVVKLLDSNTHEVLRQVPSTEMLRIAKSLEHMQGLLLDDRA